MTYQAKIQNDAASRFQSIDLTKEIIRAIHEDDLVLDGSAWWVEAGSDYFDTFTITDDRRRERYTVRLHASIERLPAPVPDDAEANEGDPGTWVAQ